MYRLVCGSCSSKEWYAPGYTDQKVRTCDPCYKQWMTYKVSSHNVHKTSVFSSYFSQQLTQVNQLSSGGGGGGVPNIGGA